MIFIPWEKALRRKSVWFSVLVLFSFGLIAIFAPRISPHDPYRWSITAAHSSLPPMWIKNTSKPGLAEFPLGTDRFGRDVLSRLLYGTRTAVFLALTAVPLAALIGTIAGLIAGYAGGRRDYWIMILADLVQSLPGIMFLVIIVLVLRNLLSPTWVNGLFTLIIGFATIAWVSLARLIRINVILIKSRVFVEAASGLGASPLYIVTHHLLPNVLHVILVWMINNIPAVILLEAVLGYIGVGVTGAVDGGEFTVVSWGGLFFSGRSAMSHNPLMILIPSLCILLMSMSFILMANFLNETTQNRLE